MGRRNTGLAAVAGLLFCASSGMTNYAARNDLPIRLPEETVDYFRKLAGRLGDVVVHVGPRREQPPPPARGETLEDDLFVVRYPPDKPEFGRHVLEAARSNVAKLEGLFGWYPYPANTGKRRLLVRADLEQAEYDREYPGTYGVCQTRLARIIHEQQA